MSKGAGHYVFKRFQQLQQFGEETVGEREATSFDQDFVQLRQMTVAMEKSYGAILKELNEYLQPDATVRIARSVSHKAGFTSKDETNKHQLYRVAEAMKEAGTAFGSTTTLGAMYLKAAETHSLINCCWVDFENETQRKYLKPLSLFDEDLKDIKTSLTKIEKDRLYLDATKARKEQARTDIKKKYDPTVVRHLDEKAQKQQAELEEKAGGVQLQMEQFFHELEDDQILVLSTFITSEIEFHKEALSALNELGEYVNELTKNPMVSIGQASGPMRSAGMGAMGAIGDRGTGPANGIRARATHDFDATDADELGFRTGDILTITNQDVGEDNWWEAMLNGRTGLIPANYVELIDTGLGDSSSSRELSQSQRAEEERVREREREEKMQLEREKMMMEREKMVMERELDGLREQVKSLTIDQSRKNAAANTALNTMSQQQNENQFKQALQVALRQMNDILDALSTNQKIATNPSFKAAPAGYDSAQNQLLDKTQQSMEMMRGLVNASYGDLPQLQLAITEALMKLTELGADTKVMASTLIDPADRSLLYESVKKVARALMDLLSGVGEVAGKDQPTIKARVGPASKKVARAIGEVLDTIDIIQANQKEAMSKQRVQEEKAEDEEMAQLLAAAKAIARVAQELSEIRDHNPAEYLAHESMLDEAQRVTSAASKLVQVATECQSLISRQAPMQGTSKTPKYHADGTWSEGLVSAAKLVAHGVEDLFTSANEIVQQGDDIDFKTIDIMKAIAQNLSGCTVQVVMAGAAKNPDRALQSRLQVAGNEVQSSVDMLVKTLSSNAYGGAGRALSPPPMSDTQKRRAEIEAQTRILAAERDLANAQKDLMSLRKGRYSKSDPKPAPSHSFDMDDLPPPPPPMEDDEDEGMDLQARLAALRR